jgi:pyrophosphatase PpaX
MGEPSGSPIYFADMPERSIKGVLFDLDGTLIDSIDHIVHCWQHTVRTCLGREISRAEVVPTLGRALLECFEEIAPGEGERMREVYRAHQKLTHDAMVAAVPGTHEALSRLRDAGLKLGVVTSKGLPATTEGLNLHGLWSYFTAFATYEDTTRHKPHPDPVLLGCERLGVAPDETVYVGDALFDIQAGKAAGTWTAAVTWGASSGDTLLGAAPDMVVDTMAELATAILAAATAVHRSLAEGER